MSLSWVILRGVARSFPHHFLFESIRNFFNYQKMAGKRACEFRSALGHFKECFVLFFWFCFVFFFSVFCLWALILLLLCRLLWPLAFIWQHSVTVLYLCICALCLFFANAFGLRSGFFSVVLCAGLCCVGYMVHKIFPAVGRRLFAGVRACHQSVLWPGAVVTAAAAAAGGAGVAVTLSASGL